MPQQQVAKGHEGPPGTCPGNTWAAGAIQGSLAQLQEAGTSPNVPRLMQGHTQRKVLGKIACSEMNACLWLGVAEEGRITLSKMLLQIFQRLGFPHITQTCKLPAPSSLLCLHEDTIRAFFLGGLLRKCEDC